MPRAGLLRAAEGWDGHGLGRRCPRNHRLVLSPSGATVRPGPTDLGRPGVVPGHGCTGPPSGTGQRGGAPGTAGRIGGRWGSSRPAFLEVP